MKQTAPHKILYALILLIVLFMIGGFAVAWCDSYREYQMFKIQEAKLEGRIAEVCGEYEEHQNYLKRFFRDLKFFKWVVRKRLGYAEPDEVIIRFEDEGTLTDNS